MEEDLDTEVQQFLELGDPNVRAQSNASQGDMPWCNRREHVQDHFDGAAERYANGMRTRGAEYSRQSFRRSMYLLDSINCKEHDP